MNNPYLDYVRTLENGFRQARNLPLGGFEPVATRDLSAASSSGLLFSPHPDDESITGLLPLRLMREAGLGIVNVPVTFGSNKEWQAARYGELRNACRFLGWELHFSPNPEEPAGRNGFHTLQPEQALQIIDQVRPSILVLPHEKDWNLRHVDSHLLVMEALAGMPPDFTCMVVETEFWGAMENPNLMVEADAASLADLVAAVSFHAGEVERNPYHLSLPAWMQDNVRRGGELVCGQGAPIPDISFATLYRVRRWQNRSLHDVLPEGQVLSMRDSANYLLEG